MDSFQDADFICFCIEDQTVVDHEMKIARMVATDRSIPRDFTPTELDSIRQIFDYFDKDKTGSISLVELKDLHTKLGEPLTDEEAELALKIIHTQAHGSLSFEEFLRWWKIDHNRSHSFEKKFKLMSAGLKKDRFDISRVVRRMIYLFAYLIQ